MSTLMLVLVYEPANVKKVPYSIRTKYIDKIAIKVYYILCQLPPPRKYPNIYISQEPLKIFWNFFFVEILREWASFGVKTGLPKNCHKVPFRVSWLKCQTSAVSTLSARRWESNVFVEQTKETPLSGVFIWLSDRLSSGQGSADSKSRTFFWSSITRGQMRKNSNLGNPRFWKTADKNKNRTLLISNEKVLLLWGDLALPWHWRKDKENVSVGTCHN